MSCEACEDIWRVDRVLPDCRNERGCLVPRLSEEGVRATELRKKVIALGNLMAPADVLKLSGATLEDLEYIGIIEEELEALRGEDAGNQNNDNV